MTKIKISLEDPRTLAIWQAILAARHEVESWPAWKRGEDNLTTGRAMPRTTSKVTSIRSWNFKNRVYRLVVLGNFTAGYDDVYILEQKSEDAAGGDRWDQIVRWSDSADPDINAILAAGIP